MAFTTSNLLTILGFTIIFTYVFTKIMEFYGIGTDVYGSYVGFYLFIILSAFILPINDSQNIMSNS